MAELITSHNTALNPNVARPGQTPVAGRPSIYRLLSLVLGHAWMFVLVPTFAAITVVVVTLAKGTYYTATASFVPQGDQNSQSQLSAIAAQFGIDVSSGAAAMSQSPAFFRTLITSDQLLKPAVEAMYGDRTGQPTDLVHFLNIDEPTRAERVAEAVRQLRDATTVSVDRETSIVELDVATHSPTISIEVVEKMLKLVNDFNLLKRREEASAERAFLQDRLDSSQVTLRAAEDRLQAFLQQNKQYQGDPQLAFVFDRLQRDVQMRQGVYTTLDQAYEQAALNVARSTPVILTVQDPTVEPTPDRRHIGLKVVIALLLGLIAALSLALCLDSMSNRGLPPTTDEIEFEAWRAQVRSKVSGILGSVAHRQNRSE